MINRLVNGILIVLVGAILLMNTTGALPWSVWDAAIGYWPILIIGLGIQVVLSKWQVPGLSLALIVVLVISALYPYYGASPFSPNPRMRMFFRNVPVSRPLQHTRELEVPLHRAVSRLGIEMVAPSLDIEAKGDPALSMPASEYAVLGELSWDKHEPVVEVSPEQSSANLQITVKSPVKEGKDAGRQMWDLRFNPSLVTAMQITGGVANINVDLNSFFVENFVVAAGVADVELKCGLSGKETTVTISGGVTNVDLEVPETAGLRISVSGPPLITRVNAKNLGLIKQGDSWVSKDYSDASTRIDVKVSCGAGKVSLKRAP